MAQCILPECRGEVEGESVEVSRGIGTLIKISELKKDGISTVLEERTSVLVHRSCRKRYTRHHERLGDKEKENKENDGPPTKRMRSSTPSFDHKIHCLFCGNLLDNHYGKKTPERHRDQVYTLSREEAKKSIALRASNDGNRGSDVHLRMCSVLDPLGTFQYHRRCHISFCTKTPGGTVRGRPVDHKKRTAFQTLCSELEEAQECQFSVQELTNRLNELCEKESGYTSQYLKELLKSHYGDRVAFTDFNGRNSVFCFRETADKFVYDTWHAARKPGEDDAIRVVKAAGKILRERIRANPFDLDHYVLSGRLDDDHLVPDVLRVLLAEVITSKTNSEQTGRTREALAQAIVQACRPRSFISPILLNVAAYLHQKDGSKLAINVLHSLGLCCSYAETRRLLVSLMNAGRPELEAVAQFVQFAWDNADHQTRTLTGHGTFHNMGGIQCSTPKQESVIPVKVPRLKGKLVIDITKGRVPILAYAKPSQTGLRRLKIEDVTVQRMTARTLKAMRKDVLWIASSCLQPDRPLATPTPAYSGFMEIAHALCGPCDVSSVDVLPFVNLEPTNRSCIYSALVFAQEQCRVLRQRTCFVTLDLPLYMKAFDIVLASEELSNVVVVLGGFHMAMSLLGCIGNIYAGSGLEDLFCTVYAKNSVPHIMSGHSYSRAMRANSLAQQSIGKLILKKIFDSDQSLCDEIASLYENIMHKESPLDDVLVSASLEKLTDLFMNECETLAKKDRTSKLWVEYFRQVEVVRLFMQSLRTGDWEQYLDSMRAMLPYFHSANHLPYARGTHIHIQNMSMLETAIDPIDFELFTKRGYFVVRHNEGNYKGVPMDYMIETRLMRHLKTCGVTRGRGLTESTIAQFVAAFPLLVPLRSRLEEFCKVRSESSEQHVELRDSRQARDQRHLERFDEWFQTHEPFAERPSDMLVSLSTGAVADASINCDRAWEIGMRSVNAVQESGQNFADIKFTRKDKVKAFASMSHNITVLGTEVPINPYQLLDRITLALDANNGKLTDYLGYELSPKPPCLFDDVSLRKTEKAALASAIRAKCPPLESPPDGAIYVVDGGMLLRAVVWPRPATYAEVCAAYRNHVLKRYGSAATIVFDGYKDSELTPKGEEQRRRSAGKTSPTLVNLQLDQFTCTAQTNFLGNGENKETLIAMIRPVLEDAGLTVLQASADADQLIAATAIQLAGRARPVVVAATDTDIFAMLIQRCPPQNDVFMLMPGVSGRPDRVHNINEVQSSLGAVQNVILFAHAMTGCDTTSAFFGKGKTSLLNLLLKNEELVDEVQLFNSVGADVEALVALGERVIFALYNASESQTLLGLRHSIFTRPTTRKDLTPELKLKLMPPTSGAARQHTLRVYLQVQEWLGRKLDATQFGWREAFGRLLPVTSDDPPAPDSLLKLVSCSCTKGCNHNCGCRRAGFPCKSYCTGCHAICTNTETIRDDDDEDDDENIDDPTM